MKEFFKKIGRGIVKGAIYIYCKIIYRMKVVGKENIPKKGPIIICGNHKSFLDPPVIEVTCGRYTRFLAKEELTKHLFLKFLLAQILLYSYHQLIHLFLIVLFLDL